MSGPDSPMSIVGQTHLLSDGDGIKIRIRINPSDNSQKRTLCRAESVHVPFGKRFFCKAQMSVGGRTLLSQVLICLLATFGMCQSLEPEPFV